MKSHHYIMIAVVFVVGYFVGVKFPSLGAKVPVVGSK